jgi:hypothetical protein
VAELGRKESGQPNGWSGWFVWGEGLRVCVRLAEGRGGGDGGRLEVSVSCYGGRKNQKPGGAPTASSFFELEIGLGLGFFFCIFLMFQNCPPFFYMCWRLLFIGKMLFKPQNWSLNFFFCKFLFFLSFLDFSYQHRLEWGKSVMFKK